MKKSNHLESWLTEAEAAEMLRISERTLRRRCAEGNGPERGERQRPGARPEPVYNPEDVARLAETKPAVFSPDSPLTLRAPRFSPAGMTAIEQLAELLQMRLQEPAPPPPRPPARWLTLKQARETTGLSLALLKRLIAAGRLRPLRDGAIKVLQADLDSLDNLQELDLAGLARTEKAKAVAGGK